MSVQSVLNLIGMLSLLNLISVDVHVCIAEVAASHEVLEASSGNGKSFRVYVMVLLSWPINSL